MTTDADEIPSAAEIYTMLKEDLHSEHPWEVQHHPEYSEIEAYITRTGQWQIIATIKCENHVMISDMIVTVFNRYTQPEAANAA